MLPIPLQVVVPTSVSATVALEPASNALNSLALLTAVDRRPALHAWVVQTAAGLTPEQRQANRLVFEGLGAALMPEGDWPDFPAYLADLAARSPTVLRDRVLEAACRPVPAWQEPQGARVRPMPMDLLADQEAYIARLRLLQADESFDEAVHAGAHELLNDPPALHHLVVAHLRAMWNEVLAPEWRRAMPVLERVVSRLHHHLAHDPEVAEYFRLLLEHGFAGEPAAATHVIDEIIFVPSPHTGRYVIPRPSGGRLRVFFDAPRNIAALLRTAHTSPIAKAELLVRLTALADDTRLRILELFATRDEISAQEIMTHLDLSQSSVSRHLKQLGPYLVAQRGGGANKLYQLSPAQIALTFRAVQHLVASGGGSTGIANARADQPGDLRRFMNRQGRITTLPARPRDMLLVLEYLASHFEPGRFYSEKEVNTLISQHIAFPDVVSVRRALCDYRVLDRTRDGARYWRAQPGAASTRAEPDRLLSPQEN